MDDEISPGFVIWDFKLRNICKEYYQRLLVLRVIEERCLHSGAYWQSTPWS